MYESVGAAEVEHSELAAELESEHEAGERPRLRAPGMAGPPSTLPALGERHVLCAGTFLGGAVLYGQVVPRRQYSVISYCHPSATQCLHATLCRPATAGCWLLTGARAAQRAGMAVGIVRMQAELAMGGRVIQMPLTCSIFH
jgi:hypothetical protein